MARIRSVHPGLWTDESFMELSDGAALLLIGLWTEADDNGVFPWKPKTIKARIRPASTEPVEPALEELRDAKFLACFVVEGKEYGAIRNFRKFQRPKKPNSIHPLPNQFRKFVGLDGESSELVPNQFPTATEIAPQMEDVGGREEVEESPPVAPPQGGKPKRKRGCRWEDTAIDALTDEWREDAVDIGVSDPERVFAKFADYWRAKPGAAGVKLDWQATWRNWCRSEVERNGKRAPPASDRELDTVLEAHARERNLGEYAGNSS